MVPERNPSDAEWAVIEPHMPPLSVRGRKRKASLRGKRCSDALV